MTLWNRSAAKQLAPLILVSQVNQNCEQG